MKRAFWSIGVIHTIPRKKKSTGGPFPIWDLWLHKSLNMDSISSRLGIRWITQSEIERKQRVVQACFFLPSCGCCFRENGSIHLLFYFVATFGICQSHSHTWINGRTKQNENRSTAVLYGLLTDATSMTHTSLINSHSLVDLWRVRVDERQVIQLTVSLERNDFRQSDQGRFPQEAQPTNCRLFLQCCLL